MQVPISWLKDYVEITLPIEELAERLTLAGLEVEHIDYIGLPGADLVWDRDKIFVGQLLKVERHPNADKLLLATVDYGAAQPIVVVTGAPNIQPGDAGQKVALALKGAKLYDGHKEGRGLMTLKEATLRGIKNDS
ncbi:MAG: phenylalanine--tRNA ligase subunit beta, partial [Candidatus Roseilinea sp.]